MGGWVKYGPLWNIMFIEYAKAMKAVGMIENYSTSYDNINMNGLSEVKLGIYESIYYTEHEDLRDNVGVISGSINTLEYYCSNSSFEELSTHGTNVVSVMAAGFNNGKGIAGIYSQGLDGVAFTLSVQDVEQLYKDKRENALNYLDKQSKYMSLILNKYLDKGYDFLIVCSAGNENSCLLAYDQSNIYGFYRIEEKETINKTYGTACSSADVIICDYVDAKYNSFLTYIETDNRCYDNIIVVGLVSDSKCISNFSDRGNRVDIYAPGESILTASFDEKNYLMNDFYEYKNGTSFAAPHVAGAAGFALNVCPKLSGKELKNLIISNAAYLDKSDIYVLNLYNLINKALDEKKTKRSVSINIRVCLLLREYIH